MTYTESIDTEQITVNAHHYALVKVSADKAGMSVSDYVESMIEEYIQDSDTDETTYLLSSPENASRLYEAKNELENGNLVTKTLDELHEFEK